MTRTPRKIAELLRARVRSGVEGLDRAILAGRMKVLVNGEEKRC